MSIGLYRLLEFAIDHQIVTVQQLRGDIGLAYYRPTPAALMTIVGYYYIGPILRTCHGHIVVRTL